MQNSLTLTAGNAVTIDTRDIADKVCLDALSVLMITSAELLRGVGKENHEILYQEYLKADDLAMRCAHALVKDYQFLSSVVQNARLATTVACIGSFPRSSSSDIQNNHKKTYIALNRESGLMKIGSSINPDRRMLQLQTGAAIVPEILLIINDDVERNLHKKFKSLCVFGEWFKDDGSIAEWIATHLASEGVAATSQNC